MFISVSGNTVTRRYRSTGGQFLIVICLIWLVSRTVYLARTRISDGTVVPWIVEFSLIALLLIAGFEGRREVTINGEKMLVQISEGRLLVRSDKSISFSNFAEARISKRIFGVNGAGENPYFVVDLVSTTTRSVRLMYYSRLADAIAEAERVCEIVGVPVLNCAV